MGFEKGLLKSNPACEIHIFDKDQFGFDEWFPAPEDRKNVHFHRVFVGMRDANETDPPRQRLSTIMKGLRHTHLDVLKMDIEGSEWPIFQGPLPSLGQLLVEVHLSKGDAAPLNDDGRIHLMKTVFNNLEGHGLRLFHKEINARWDMSAAELSFIQEKWTPFKKFYGCA